MKSFWEYALVRALRTICQTLASLLPVGFIVSPEIIKTADWSMVYIILAWIGTGLLSGVASMLTSIATGLPEVEYEQHLYMSVDVPEDAEVEDGEE